jgi:hypothetical protein
MRRNKLIGLILGIVVAGVISCNSHQQQKPSETREDSSDTTIQIHGPQWAATGREGVSVMTGFDGNGQRIVVTTDGESTCGVGLSEGEWDSATHRFTGRELPNANYPIYLTIYGDDSGGTIKQLQRDGSTETCGVFVSR